MSEKVLLVVKLAYENYAKNYNWFLLVDDDTYIFYDNLIKSSSAKIYYSLFKCQAII